MEFWTEYDKQRAIKNSVRWSLAQAIMAAVDAHELDLAAQAAPVVLALAAVQEVFQVHEVED
jgi:hypothetical protein